MTTNITTGAQGPSGPQGAQGDPGAPLGKASSATTYNLSSADNGYVISFTANSGVTLNVPVGLPVGFSVGVVASGTGDVTPTAVSTTIHNRQSFTKTAGQYAMMSLTMVATDVFILAGDGA